MRHVRTVLASAILLACLPSCRERLVRESAGGVRFALPAWPHRNAQAAAAAGFVERADGKGDRVILSWDVDARIGKPGFALARDASGVARGEILPATVAGHEAWLLSDKALVWRCDKTGRLLRLVADGEHAPAVAALAPQVDCHGAAGLTNGDVPSASIAALGPAWRFAHRGPASLSWLRDDAVLTLFAGQSLPVPASTEAAREAASAWTAAAGLTGSVPQSAQSGEGPQGHPALRVTGTAKLDGAPVRWTLLSWRCIQRQRSFAALVFARAGQADAPGDHTGHDAALLSARCHGSQGAPR